MISTPSPIRKLILRLLNAREMSVIIPLALAFVIFGSINNNFFSLENLISIFRSTAFVFISAIGMTYLLITGAFDLSVGAVIAFSGISVGMLMQAGVPIPASIAVTILLAMTVGLINGFITIKIKVPPFITTLGMMYMLKGVVLGVREGKAVFPLPEAFNEIGQGSLGSVPYVVVIALALAVIAHIVLTKTLFGRMLMAVGGNSETARVSGIPCDKIRFAAFAIVSSLASVTGILMAARMGSGQPTAGTNYEMLTIAGAIIGGTSLFGGVGTIIGTLLGALFMTVLTNGMTLVKISPYWQQFVLGAIIILSVAQDQLRTARKHR